ncbi:MAG: reverse transcriptase domain-containing protein [Ardenticatenales bacterium]
MPHPFHPRHWLRELTARRAEWRDRRRVDDRPSAAARWGPPERSAASRPLLRPSRAGAQSGAFSESALRRAWRRVQANGGGAGVDGVDIAAYEQRLDDELATLGHELRTGTYRPRPVRRIFVPKAGEGLRPLALWALRDRVAQRSVYDLMEPLFDGQFLTCSHGFRPGRSVQTAVRAVVAARDAGNGWVVDTDIKDCFDSLDSAILLALVKRRVKDRRLIDLVRRWLDVRVLDAHGRLVAAGAAQGGSLSPLLCNIYLNAFDQAMLRHGIPLVRYADDFVCLQPRRADAERALSLAGAELASLKLQLHPTKTRVVHFDDGFKFLGYFFVRREHYPL